MKSPVVDYREFRLSRLNEPRFAHLKLLGGWPVYFALFFLTENLIPVSACHVVHCALDDLIPFREGLALAYCYRYFLLVGSMLYALLYDIRTFKRLQVYIMVTQAAAVLIYIAWPSVQLLRPEHFARDNLLTRLMGLIYAFDTPTGVCPSLHVAYSLGIASAWCHCEGTPKGWKAFAVLSAAAISLSTAFVKQHSVVDICAAVPVGLLAEWLVYGRTRIGRYCEDTPDMPLDKHPLSVG